MKACYLYFAIRCSTNICRRNQTQIPYILREGLRAFTSPRHRTSLNTQNGERLHLFSTLSASGIVFEILKTIDRERLGILTQHGKADIGISAKDFRINAKTS